MGRRQRVMLRHFAEHLPRHLLRGLAHLHLRDAAKRVGVSLTTLKRVCRLHGVRNWPARQLQSVDHRRRLQAALGDVPGALAELQRLDLVRAQVLVRCGLLREGETDSEGPALVELVRDEPLDLAVARILDEFSPSVLEHEEPAVIPLDVLDVPPDGEGDFPAYFE